VLHDGNALILFLVDTRGLTLEERGMAKPTAMGLDIDRAEFLAAVDRAIRTGTGAGLGVVVYDP
jgi:hypothetical protein